MSQETFTYFAIVLIQQLIEHISAFKLNDPAVNWTLIMKQSLSVKMAM